MNIVRIISSAVVAALVMAFLGYFSASPAYQYFDRENALVKVAVTHASQRKDPCRDRTAEELAKLRPNMRKAQACSRERLPTLLEFVVNGKVVFSEWKRPSGLSKDGMSTFYARFPVPVGHHDLVVRMRDSHREEGFDYETAASVDIKPLQVFVVRFHSEAGGFTFQ